MNKTILVLKNIRQVTININSNTVSLRIHYFNDTPIFEYHQYVVDLDKSSTYDIIDKIQNAYNSIHEALKKGDMIAEIEL
jgi:hypothetical protein